MCLLPATRIRINDFYLFVLWFVDSLVQRVAARFLRAAIQVPVPLVEQPVDFSCGSAALFACLLYWLGEGAGLNATSESELWGAIGIDAETGAEPEALAKVALELDLDAVPVMDLTIDDLRQCLEAGITAILCVQAWKKSDVRYRADYEDAHYVVLVGLDDEKATVMDPWLENAYGKIPLDQLALRWHNPDSEGQPQEHMAVLIRGKQPILQAPPMPEVVVE
jgi:predicted double-glycine peptidase